MNLKSSSPRSLGFIAGFALALISCGQTKSDVNTTALMNTQNIRALKQALWNGKILDVANEVYLEPAELFERLVAADTIVFGEKHYTPVIQIAESEVISGVVRAAEKEQAFSVGWEFLIRSNQEAVRTLYKNFQEGQITAEDFIRETQAVQEAETYVPVLETIKALGGELFATNLSRAERKIVVDNGLSQTDPSWIPPGFAMGGEDYFGRFRDTMQGHVAPEKLLRYFEAQCLTDDVMAYSVLLEAHFNLRFLISGSFHVEYRDGVISRLVARAPAERLLTVDFIDASDYSETELRTLLNHTQYGPIADFAYFFNEPSAPSSSK